MVECRHDLVKPKTVVGDRVARCLGSANVELDVDVGHKQNPSFS